MPGRATRSPARRWLRRLLWTLLLVLLVVAGLAGIAGRALQTPWARNALRGLIERQVSAAIQGRLRLAALGGRLPFKPMLAGVELRGAAAGARLVWVERVGLEIDPWALLDGRIAIERLQLVRPQLWLQATDAGQLDLLRALEPVAPGPQEQQQQQPSQLALRIERLRLAGGRIALRRPDGRRIELTGLAALAWLDWSAGRLRLRLHSLAGRWLETGWPLRLAARAEVAGSRMTVHHLQLALGPSRLSAPALDYPGRLDSLSGRLRAALAPSLVRRLAPALTPRAALRLRARAVPADAAAGGLKARLHAALGAGRLEWTGRLWLDAPRIEGLLSHRRLDPSALLAAAPAGALAGRWRLDVAGATLDALRGHIDAGVNGRLAPLAQLDLDLDVELAAERLSADLELALPQGRASARLGLRLAAEPRLEPSRLQLELADLGRLAPAGTPAAGSAALDASLHGPLDALVLQGRLSGRSLRLGSVAAERIDGSVALTGLPARPEGRLELAADPLALDQRWRGPVELGLRAGAGGRRLALTFSAGRAGSDLATAGRLVLERDTAGQLEVAHIERLRLDLGPQRWRSRGGRLVRDGRRLELRDLHLASSAGRLSLAGALADGELQRLALRLRGLDLAALGRALPLTGAERLCGRVGLRLELERGAGGLQAELQSRLREVCPLVDEQRVSGHLAASLRRGRLQGRLQLDSGATTLELSLAARAPADPWEAAGWARLRPAALDSLRLHFDGLDLERVYSAAGSDARPLTGTVAGRIDVASGGERIGLRLALSEGRLQPLAAGLDATWNATIDGRRLQTSADVDLGTLGRIELQAAGRLAGSPLRPAGWKLPGREQLERAALHWRGARLGDWLDQIERSPLFGQPELPEQLADANGRAEAEFELDSGARELRGELRLDGLRRANMGVAAALQLELSAGAETSTTRLRSYFGEQKLLAGNIELQSGLTVLIRDPEAWLDSAMSGRLELHPTAVTPLLAAAGYQDTASGRLQARFQFSGRLHDPRLEGRLRIEQLALAQVSLGDLTLRADIDRRRSEVVIENRRSDGGYLSLRGRLQHPRGEIDAELRADGFELAPAAELLRTLGGPLVDFSGALSADLHLGGTVEQPRPRGWLYVDAGSLLALQGQRPIEQLTLAGRIDPDWLRLDLKGRMGAGRLGLSLDAGMHRYRPQAVDASIMAEALPVVAGGMLLAVDLEGRLQAELEEALWRGRLEVDRALVRLPQGKALQLHPTDLPEAVTFVGADNAAAAQPAAAEAAEPEAEPQAEGTDRSARQGAAGAAALAAVPADFRLTVSAPGTITVRDEAAELRLKSDVELSRVDGELSISGAVEALQGRLSLFERIYEVRQARIAFGGRMPPDPRLDITLEHDFTVATVRIHARGSASQPELSFSSLPAEYSQSQLLAMVLGGEPGDAAAADEELQLQDQALQAAAGLLLSGLRGILRRALPIDTLGIETSTEEETTTAEVVVGKWITEDLFVAYRYRMGADEDENANAVEVQYRLGRDWVLEGFYGDGAEGGVDVLWIKRF
jgi:translocation and assembly module TamB